LLVVVAVAPLVVVLVLLVRHRLTVGLVQQILVLEVTVELAQVAKRVGLVEVELLLFVTLTHSQRHHQPQVHQLSR
jgi:hypothetical protein